MMVFGLLVSTSTVAKEVLDSRRKYARQSVIEATVRGADLNVQPAPWTLCELLARVRRAQVTMSH